MLQLLERRLVAEIVPLRYPSQIMKDMETLRTRFAPSPTGNLHVGGARTALFCKAWARSNGGLFVLRIEDTDQARSSVEAENAILEDLAWLGLEWDEGPVWESEEGSSFGGGSSGPYRQSERREKYENAINKLIKNGHAYPAFETSEELAQARSQARKEKRPYKYDRSALSLSELQIKEKIDQGIPHVIRFKVPTLGSVVVEDEVLGTVEVKEEELEDFVIRKADGFPTYHMAVVVDDEDMNITHVVRGSEHLANTIKHVMLQDALGYPRPIFAHLPLIMNSDGSKMSKRDRDKALRKELQSKQVQSCPVQEDKPLINPDLFDSWTLDKHSQLDPEQQDLLAEHFKLNLPEIAVEDFRSSGYLPEVLINYLGLLGWSTEDGREKFNLSYLENKFDLKRIGKSAARFDREKLLSFHLDYLQEMTHEDFEKALREWCERYYPDFCNLSEESFRLFASCTKERSKTLADPVETCRFLVINSEKIFYEESKSVRKAMLKSDPNGFDILEACREKLQEIESWNLESIRVAIENLAQIMGGGQLGKIAHPLRVALTGRTVSPPIVETLQLLGSEEADERISRCLREHPMNQECGK